MAVSEQAAGQMAEQAAEDREKTTEETAPQAKIGYWLSWIKAAKKAAKDHWDDSKAAWAEYENKKGATEDAAGSGQRLYPIYKFSCDILEPSYYAKTPKAKIRRRFGIEDPMALTMSLIAERLVSSGMESCGFDWAMKAVRGDYIHAAKATAQYVYKAQTEKALDPATQQEIEQVVEETQRITLAPCPFDEVLHTPDAKTPLEITEMAYKFCLEKSEAIEMFGKKDLPWKGSKESSEYGEDSEDKPQKVGSYLEGWECWCSKTRKVYWVCEEYSEGFLLEKDDPLGLRGFFPSPKFILQNNPRKNLYPTPNWVYLEATANQLNVLYKRIFRLVDSIRRRALVYGASTELIRALNSLEGEEFISAGALTEILEKGGLDSLIAWMPVQELVQALQEAVTIEDHFKNLFYEWFGVPDILRGVSDPGETAAAQEIKGEAAHDRFQYGKLQIFEFAREAAEMLLDIQLAVYSDGKIAQLVGHEYMQRGTPAVPPSEENPEGVPAEPSHYERFPEALARLRSDTQRMIQVDFETDSTSFRDEQKELAKAQQIAETLVKGLGTIGSMNNQEYGSIALEMLLRVLEGMGGSSWSEDMVKKAVNDLLRARANPPPPPPDYEAMKIEVKKQENEIKAQKNQIDAQVDARKLDQKAMDMELKAVMAKQEQMLAQFSAQVDASIQQALVSQGQQRVDIEAFKAKILAQETLLEEVRLRQEADAALIQTAIAAAEKNTPEAPTTAAAPTPVIPNMTFNVTMPEMPKPGKRIGRIVRPDGTVTELEVEDKPEEAPAPDITEVL